MLTSKTLVRRMSSLVSSLVCKEVTVPVPWGVISAKQWSSPGPVQHQSEGREVKQWNEFFILIIISAGAGGPGGAGGAGAVGAGGPVGAGGAGAGGAGAGGAGVAGEGKEVNKIIVLML